jgi:uncharacterized membrane protein
MNTPRTSVFICILAMSALGHFLPKFTRPDLFFGVTVDPAIRATDEARRILRRYRIALWGSTIAAGTLDVVLHRPVIALILYVIGICCAQVASQRRALIHAASRSTTIEVDLSSPREQIPGGLLTALLPLIVLVGLGLWAVPHVDQLPLRMPVHWGSSGPNRWVITSSRAIIVLLAQHAFICLVLIASALGVLHWSRRIAVSGPSAASERQFRRRTVLLILTAEYFTILPPIFSLLQAPPLAMKVWSVALIVTIVVFVMRLMHAGQGGARLVGTGRGPIGDRTADERWIGGFLYFNPTDPALLVERRMGIGWTVNFGNPWSWVPVIAVAVVVVVVAAPLTVPGGSHLAAGGPLRPDNPGLPLQNKSASPGTDEALRRYILSLERGHPNYEEMSPQLAAAVNQQLPKIMATISGLGEFTSLTYEGTDTVGADVYIAAFAQGRLEYHIGPLVDGKVAYRQLRPLP